MNFIDSKVVWARIFFRVDPLPSGSEKKGRDVKKVPSNQLKIGQRVAYGFAIFPFPQISCFQNSYGFRAI